MTPPEGRRSERVPRRDDEARAQRRIGVNGPTGDGPDGVWRRDRRSGSTWPHRLATIGARLALAALASVIAHCGGDPAPGPLAAGGSAGATGDGGGAEVAGGGAASDTSAFDLAFADGAPTCPGGGGCPCTVDDECDALYCADDDGLAGGRS